MNIEILKKRAVKSSGVLNGRAIDAMEKNCPEYVGWVNSLITRDDLTFKEKVIFIVKNGNDNCRSCGSSIDRLPPPKQGLTTFNFLCKECSSTSATDQRKKTMVERYGVENSMLSSGFREKQMRTNIERYGVSNAMQHTGTKDKVTTTNIERYGAKCSLHGANVNRKVRDTFLEKYGSENYTQSKDYVVKHFGMDESLATFWVEEPEKVYEIYKKECHGNLTLLADKFGVSFQTTSRYFQRNNLEVVNVGFSASEKRFRDDVSELAQGLTVLYNVRDVIGPKELDIYIPEKKLAIEFCGAFWHSEAMKPEKGYHYEKWKNCKTLGIKLLTFWDLEVEARRKQIMSFISSNLGIYERKIYARETEFVEVNENLNWFFEENHIQGKVRIDRNFALIEKKSGKIVGAVSYAPHHRDGSKMTLNRIAFQSGTHVVGGFSKLIKNSANLIDDDIITWSDNRYSTGEVYQDNGFDFEADVRPDYTYIDIKANRLRSKQSCTKKAIGCPDDMTERDYMAANKCYRIWDCGKKRFVIRKVTLNKKQR